MFLLACYAATFVLIESELLAVPRARLSEECPLLKRMLQCWLCTGFWASAMVSACWFLATEHQGAVLIPVYALGGAASTYILDKKVRRWEIEAEVHYEEIPRPPETTT